MKCRWKVILTLGVALCGTGCGQLPDDGQAPTDTAGSMGRGDPRRDAPDANQQFEVEVDIAPSNAGTVSLVPPGGQYESGVIVELLAIPVEGFEFLNFSGDVVSENDSLVITVDRALSVTAEFAPLMYTVSTTAVPGDSGRIELVPPGGVYAHGTEVTLSAETNKGFLFEAFLDQDSEVLSDQATMSVVVTADLIVNAHFVDAPPGTFTLNVTPEPANGGTVSIDPNSTIYEAGTAVALTAVPEAGYEFAGYFDEAGVLQYADAQWSITLNDDLTVFARFVSVEPVSFLLTVEAFPAEGGEVQLDPPGGQYDQGTLVTVTAQPNPGYAFVEFTNGVSDTSATVAILMDADVSLAAHFTWNPQIGNPGNVVVSGFVTSNVIEFDAIDGGRLGDLVAAGSGQLNFAAGLDFGSQGDLFVVSVVDNDILRYDGHSGAPLGTFVEGTASAGFLSLRFGPNGNLFVSDGASNGVLEFDGASGDLVGTFAGSEGAIDNPIGLAFDATGQLFVVSNGNDHIVEYSPDGALVGVLADLGAAGLRDPVDVVVHPMGGLLATIASVNSVAWIGMDGSVEALVNSASGGLDAPAGLSTSARTGHILVVSQGTNSVLEFDGTTGAFLGEFATGNGDENLFFLTLRE